MTIRKGEPWGEPAVCPPTCEWCRTDRELRDWVIWHRTRGPTDSRPRRRRRRPGAHAVAAATGRSSVVGEGDRRRDAGDARRRRTDMGRGPRRRPSPVVAGRVGHGDERRVLRPYDVAPRSHPNDGKLDVLRVDAVDGLARAAAGAPNGPAPAAILPHRHLSLRSVSDVDLDFDRPMVVWIDGVRCGTASRLQVSVEPDAFTAYV